MKYSSNNLPMVCIMTNSTCYKKTEKMNIKGVLWHSTGSNNKTIKRYVQPSETDKNYQFLINKIGKNTNRNDWNHI
nr:MAG TPA: N-acetylmuramoyl-L-alanine amidase [Caudoviricetes sp.]